MTSLFRKKDIRSPDRVNTGGYGIPFRRLRISDAQVCRIRTVIGTVRGLRPQTAPPVRPESAVLFLPERNIRQTGMPRMP